MRHCLHRPHPVKSVWFPTFSLAASEGVGITPTTFYPCQPLLRPATLYCVRPKAIREAKMGAHLSDTRFSVGTPGTVAAAPTRQIRPNA